MSQRLRLELCCVVRRFLSLVRCSCGCWLLIASLSPLRVIYDFVLCCCEYLVRRRPTNRGLPPHRCSSPLKQRVEHGRSHPLPSQEVGDSWPMKNSKTALFGGSTEAVFACLYFSFGSRIAGHVDAIDAPARPAIRSAA